MTNREIIEAAGGSLALAVLLAIRQDTVENWYQGGIPPKHWSKIVEQKFPGVTWEALAKTREAA